MVGSASLISVDRMGPVKSAARVASPRVSLGAGSLSGTCGSGLAGKRGISLSANPCRLIAHDPHSDLSIISIMHYYDRNSTDGGASDWLLCSCERAKDAL